MNIEFGTYEDFLEEYKKYHMDKCDDCNGICEIMVEPVNAKIDDKTIYCSELSVLQCIQCGTKYLPQYSKKMIGGCYQNLLKENQTKGSYDFKDYSEKFDYCQEQDFSYDHKDYYNIPGLCLDNEHTVKGFLTPVYFERKTLIYFMASPEYEAEIFSETYGFLGKKDFSERFSYEWNIPFGFNSNGKLIFWLGDLDTMDTQSKMIMKSFNIQSDHLLTNSEFFQAQMNCIFSEPIKEKQILINKDTFVSNIKRAYGVDISHLNEECKVYATEVKRPASFSEQEISKMVNNFDKILVEGFSVEQLQVLYEKLNLENRRTKGYKQFKSIKLIENILVKLCEGVAEDIDVKELMSPLYVLNNHRIYSDHLLSNDKQEEIKNHILDTLDIQSFDCQEEIYHKEIDGLNRLFQYLAILSR